MSTEALYVNLAEIRVASSPSELICLGLGSCIAVALYDPQIKMGGLAHVLLPDSSIASNQNKPGKFANTAVNELLKIMRAKGAKLENIQAKIFGGAEMFPGINGYDKKSIGECNTLAVIKELEDLEKDLE